jgi:branched-chain amino acid transport system ATP-binding protein
VTPLIAARGIFAGYHGVAVLRDFDLEVAGGEMVLLAGPNGAGKTTAVKTLAGTIRPLSGAVELDGATTTLPTFRRVRQGLGILPEQRSVFGHLTLLENLRLGRGSVEEAMAHFPELEPRLNLPAGLLSGGEQQMLALARVISAKPKVILADEMSLGLAPKIVKRLLAVLRALANGGTGVLLVEQHIHLALDICDRATFLKLGTVQLSGAAEDLKLRHAEVDRIYL